MAISKERKRELVELYSQWIEKSQAMILAEYFGLSVKELEDLRIKIREVDGEFHVLKNTLAKLAFEAADLPIPEGFFEGSTAIGFAFEDIPGVAKALVSLSKERDTVKIKGGYLNNQVISANEIRDLANLPPLPVLRAMLLATILAPATQLVRTLNEPARQIAAVLKAYSEQEAAQVAS